MALKHQESRYAQIIISACSHQRRMAQNVTRLVCSGSMPPSFGIFPCCCYATITDTIRASGCVPGHLVSPPGSVPAQMPRAQTSGGCQHHRAQSSPLDNARRTRSAPAGPVSCPQRCTACRLVPAPWRSPASSTPAEGTCSISFLLSSRDPLQCTLNLNGDGEVQSTWLCSQLKRCIRGKSCAVWKECCVGCHVFLSPK